MTDKDKELSLTIPSEDLEEKILTSEDPDELIDMIDIFNLNLKKRNIIRNNKLNDIQDRVVDKMLQKIEEEPWEFSNDDLVKFYKVTQDTLSKSQNIIDKESLPTIQVNQQINVSAPEFNRESRAKILSAVHDILANVDSQSILEEIEEANDDNE